MLKNLNLPSFAIAFLLLFSSCSQDQQNQNFNDLKSVNELLSDFENYDSINFPVEDKVSGDIVSGEIALRGDCKGFWDCARRTLEVAAADLIGAGGGAGAVQIGAAAAGAATAGVGYAVVSGVGAAIGAAGASSAAIRAQEYVALPPAEYQFGNIKNLVNIQNPYGDLVISISDFDPKFHSLQDVGVNHNLIMNDYNRISKKPDNNLYKNLKVDSKDLIIFDYIDKNNIFEKIESLVVKNYTEENNYDHKLLISSFKEANLISNNTSDILNVFVNSFKKINTNDDLEKLIHYYFSNVSKSQLSDNDKYQIYSALMVASQSPFYAKKYMEYVEKK